MRVLLFIAVLFSLLGCQSFKNRAPQSAGFGGYCPTCLVKNIDKDLAELQSTFKKAGWEAPKEPPKTRYATVFDKAGKVICQVDLLKHPDAVPNFAQLDKQEFVQNTKSNNRQPASAKAPPACSKEYLAKIKEVANNNVVLNGNKNFKKKVSLKKEMFEAGAWCLVGIGAGGAIGAKMGNSNEALASVAAVAAGMVPMAMPNAPAPRPQPSTKKKSTVTAKSKTPKKPASRDVLREMFTPPDFAKEKEAVRALYAKEQASKASKVTKSKTPKASKVVARTTAPRDLLSDLLSPPAEKLEVTNKKKGTVTKQTKVAKVPNPFEKRGPQFVLNAGVGTICGFGGLMAGAIGFH